MSLIWRTAAGHGDRLQAGRAAGARLFRIRGRSSGAGLRSGRHEVGLAVPHVLSNGSGCDAWPTLHRTESWQSLPCPTKLSDNSGKSMSDLEVAGLVLKRREAEGAGPEH